MRWKPFVQHYGIDLGTAYTKIYQLGKGIVLREPSAIAINRNTGEVEAVGTSARTMIGRSPEHIEIVHPLQDGVIANYQLVAELIKHFLHKISNGKSRWARKEVVISVPCGITNVQKRAVEETNVQGLAKNIVTIEEPLAAAIGAGLAVNEPMGHLVVDIGGGKTQAAVLSLGGIVVSHNNRRGGMAIDEEIVEYVKKSHNVSIGLRTAEEIKQTIGTVLPIDELKTMQVRGRDLIEGLPITIEMTNSELYEVLHGFIGDVLFAIRSVLEKCPPELAGDIIEHGIMLCGGGALLDGIDKRLQAELQVPVYIADDPQACVVLGNGKVLEFEHPGRRSGFSSKTDDWWKVGEVEVESYEEQEEEHDEVYAKRELRDKSVE